jgi:adenosylmethionine-8-amino-7-oxononanoate aminotransferase
LLEDLMRLEGIAISAAKMVVCVVGWWDEVKKFCKKLEILHGAGYMRFLVS